MCGILSLACFSILTGIPAVILGHLFAVRHPDAASGRLEKGERMALGGLILGLYQHCYSVHSGLLRRSADSSVFYAHGRPPMKLGQWAP